MINHMRPGEHAGHTRSARGGGRPALTAFLAAAPAWIGHFVTSAARTPEILARKQEIDAAALLVDKTDRAASPMMTRPPLPSVGGLGFPFVDGSCRLPLG
jgi:hypothetical protein